MSSSSFDALKNFQESINKNVFEMNELDEALKAIKTLNESDFEKQGKYDSWFWDLRHPSQRWLGRGQ